jgi:hypothetical protein
MSWVPSRIIKGLDRMIAFIDAASTVTLNYNHSYQLTIGGCLGLLPFPFWAMGVFPATVAGELINSSPRWILTTPFHDGFVSTTHGFSAATDCKRPSYSFITLRHGPHRKHINCPATDILYCYQACLLTYCLSMGTLLLSRAYAGRCLLGRHLTMIIFATVI